VQGRRPRTRDSARIPSARGHNRRGWMRLREKREHKLGHASLQERTRRPAPALLNVCARACAFLATSHAPAPGLPRVSSSGRRDASLVQTWAR
jgi:hypothetical protein